MIYDNLLEIADDFDVFLFDAYGVFWEGNGFYPLSREAMTELVQRGKKVIVISNTTRLQKDMMKSYAQKGMEHMREYTHFYTSGDLLRRNLEQNKVSFTNCPLPQKYYVIGLPHKKAFADLPYEQVKTLKEADFVYIGVPFMFAEDVDKYPQFSTEYYPVAKDEYGQIKRWDTLTAEPFIDIVNKIAESKLPILNANPDFYAKEGHPLMPASPSVFVVRNGLIAEMLRQRGAEVLEYGKPHKNIYDYVFEQLKQEGIKINNKRTCMIGDTVRTDIKGGINAGIVPILCVQTGVTAEEIMQGKSVENLCNNENIDIKQIIQIKSVGGNL